MSDGRHDRIRPKHLHVPERRGPEGLTVRLAVEVFAEALQVDVVQRGDVQVALGGAVLLEEREVLLLVDVRGVERCAHLAGGRGARG